MFRDAEWWAVLEQFQSVALVAVAVGLALVEPVAGDRLTPLVTPFVAVLVYSSVRAIDVGDVDYRAVSIPLLGLAISFAVVPVAALSVGGLVLSGAALVGVVVMAAGPSTAGSALVWTRLSDGDVVVTVTIVVATLLLAPVVTPVLVTELLGAQTQLSTLPILRELLFVVVGGLALTLVVPDGAIDERWMDRISLGIICGLVYIGVASSSTAAVGIDVVGLVALASLAICLVALGLSVGIGAVAGLGRERVRALFFASGMKNLGIAIVVAAALPTEGVVVAIVTFYVVQQLLAGTIVALVE